MNSDKLETRDKRKQAGTIKLSRPAFLTVTSFVRQKPYCRCGYGPRLYTRIPGPDKAYCLCPGHGRESLPLERAQAHVKGNMRQERARRQDVWAVPIHLRLSDGLKELKPGEADTVIIAGMGGELIIKILDEGRHVWDSVNSLSCRRSRTWISKGVIWPPMVLPLRMKPW